MFARTMQDINSFRMRWIPALVAIVALAGCASSNAGSTADYISSPGVFRDDLDGKIAAHGDHLWLAKTGISKAKEVRTQVLEYDGDNWSPLPGLPRSTTDAGLALTAHKFGAKVAPCVGFSAPKETMRVRCFRKTWRNLKIPAEWRNTYLKGLVSRNGKLFALFQKNLPGPRGTSILQLTVLKGERFRTLGPSKTINVGVVSDIVEQTKGTPLGPIEIGITSTVTPAERWLLTLKGNKWSRSRSLPQSIGGTMMSGPVRSGDSTYFPVNETDFNDERNYMFSIFSETESSPWEKINDEPLNQGFGHAQGEVYPVGRDVWAIWSEFDTSGSRFGGWFPVETYTAPLNSDGAELGPVTTLWSGRLIFPSGNQVVQYRGRPAFFYMRQFKRRGGIQATVRISGTSGE